MHWTRFLPDNPEIYGGPQIPFYFLILITVINTARSLVHMLAPDGGAKSIAGIDISVEGGKNLVSIFSQRGAMQLLMACISWIVILRYPGLSPLRLAFVTAEQILRIAMGRMKPLVIAAPPPGAKGSKILLPVAIAALVWSLA